ncbi:DUF6438 domain-containing protein, partial [Sphingomonas sp.]|uniref:DUF6438 domain-containing protein n=2 Tax=unclassified Sphingomonas TaxID=196159 RepID=UPI00289E3BDB
MTRYLTMAALSAAMMLGGCATTGRAGRPATSTPGETVRVAVGPCFGFCPVYSVSVAPDGAVHFVGERHTAVLGARTTRVPAPVPSALVRDLARYRPATGDDVPVACTAAVSDTSA